MLSIVKDSGISKRGIHTIAQPYLKSNVDKLLTYTNLQNTYLSTKLLQYRG